MPELNIVNEIKTNTVYYAMNTFSQWEIVSLDLNNLLLLLNGVQEIFHLLKHICYSSIEVVWPSGLRRWFKAPISSEARVRISSLSVVLFIFRNTSDAKPYS